MIDFDPTVLDDLARAAARLGGDSAERLLAHRSALMGRPLLFRYETLERRFIVGDPDAPAILYCDILAACGAHLALANPGRAGLVRAADFAAPGAEYPDNSVRTGIKRFADVLERNGQRAIASEVRRLTVRAGFIVAPGRRRLTLLTE